jgi:perosamine synthetase
MDPILKIARKYGLNVIEDAAEAHGATYKGKRVGGIGDLGAFSFYGNKIITTGEGGMVTTNNKEYTEKIRTLRDHAMSPSRRYWHDVLGYNYRLTNIQAAIGVAQMEQIDSFIETKRRNASLYKSYLHDIDGIALPPESEECGNVYWMYSVLIENSFGISRDELILRLTENGIDSRPFFYPLSQLPMYSGATSNPIADSLSRKGINLPSATTLSPDDIKTVCSTLLELKTFFPNRP